MPSRFGNVIVGFGADLGDFEKGLSKIEKRLNKLSSDLGRAGRALSVGLTLPIAGLGIAAVKSSGLLDDLFSRLQSRSSNVLKQLGGDIVRALDLRELTSKAISLIDGLGRSLSELPPWLKDIAIRTAAVIALVGPLTLGLAGMLKVMGSLIVASRLFLVNMITLAVTPVGLVLLGLAAAAGTVALKFSQAAHEARILRGELTLEEARSELEKVRAEMIPLQELLDKAADQGLRFSDTWQKSSERLGRLSERFQLLQSHIERIQVAELTKALGEAGGRAEEAARQALFFSGSQDRLQLSIEGTTAELNSIKATLQKLIEDSGKPLHGILSTEEGLAIATRMRELQERLRGLTDEQERFNEAQRLADAESQALALQAQQVAELGRQYTTVAGIIGGPLVSASQGFINSLIQIGAFGGNIAQALAGAFGQLASQILVHIGTVISALIVYLATEKAVAASIFGDSIANIVANIVEQWSATSLIGWVIGLGVAAGAVAATIALARSSAQKGSSSIKGLEEGGLVTGPTLALIGEGREDELVAPLSKVPDLLGMDDFHQEINVHLDGYRLARAQARGLPRVLRIHGVG